MKHLSADYWMIIINAANFFLYNEDQSDLLLNFTAQTFVMEEIIQFHSHGFFYPQGKKLSQMSLYSGHRNAIPVIWCEMEHVI